MIRDIPLVSSEIAAYIMQVPLVMPHVTTQLTGIRTHASAWGLRVGAINATREMLKQKSILKIATHLSMKS